MKIWATQYSIILVFMWILFPKTGMAGTIHFNELTVDIDAYFSLRHGDSAGMRAISFFDSPGTAITVYGQGSMPNGLPYNAVPLGEAFCMLSTMQVSGLSDVDDFGLDLNFLFSYEDGYQDIFSLEIEHIAGQNWVTFTEIPFSRKYQIRNSNFALQMVGFTDSSFTDWDYPGLYDNPWPNTTGIGMLGDLWAKPVVVPEPESICLFLVGLFFIGWLINWNRGKSRPIVAMPLTVSKNSINLCDFRQQGP